MIATPRPTPRNQPLFTAEQWQRIAAHLQFSRREKEVMQLVFEDFSDQAIAAELAVSVNTVHTYLKRLYAKMATASRAGLILGIFRVYLADLQRAAQPKPVLQMHSAARKAA